MKKNNSTKRAKSFASSDSSSSSAQVTHGSGNIFADLGLPNAEELQWKSSLVFEIRQRISAKGLTQAQVAEIVGMDQPKVSKLLSEKFSEFSISRMLRVLNRLGHNVEVRVATQQVAPEDARTVVKAVAKVA